MRSQIHIYRWRKTGTDSVHRGVSFTYFEWNPGLSRAEYQRSILYIAVFLSSIRSGIQAFWGQENTCQFGTWPFFLNLFEVKSTFIGDVKLRRIRYIAVFPSRIVSEIQVYRGQNTRGPFCALPCFFQGFGVESRPFGDRKTHVSSVHDLFSSTYSKSNPRLSVM